MWSVTLSQWGIYSENSWALKCLGGFLFWKNLLFCIFYTTHCIYRVFTPTQNTHTKLDHYFSLTSSWYVCVLTVWKLVLHIWSHSLVLKTEYACVSVQTGERFPELQQHSRHVCSTWAAHIFLQPVITNIERKLHIHHCTQTLTWEK